MNIELIDHQPDFIIVNKPADISFHDDNQLGCGFFNQVKRRLNIAELYPVHRLDKITSGLMIMATTSAAAQQFQHLFAQHHIEKYYLAISTGKPKKKQGLIKGDMAKSRRGMWKLLHTKQNPAITQFFSFSLGAGKRLYLLKPRSGKTHQIRVALNSLSTPILGDSLYGGQSAERGYLHAYALSFDFNGQKFQYQLLPSQGDYALLTNNTELVANIASPWNLAWPKL